MKIILRGSSGARLAAGLAVAATLGAACEPVPPSQPTEAIILCGSTCISGTDLSNQVSKTTGGVATFAWGTEELLPPAGDPYGAKHRLTWTASSPTQLLIAFDTDFSAPIPDPSCPLCSEPYAWSFVTLPGTGGPTSKDYSFAKPQDGWSGFTTGHLIRVDRGACRSVTNWSVIFEQVKEKLDSSVACAMKCSSRSASSRQINRLNVDIQPHFTGVKDDVQHGLLLTATYEIKSWIGRDLVGINPVYAFGVDPATGRLDVKVLQLGVTAFDDDLKAGVETALSQQFAKELPTFVDPQAFMTMTGFDESSKCDKQAPLASQQASCLIQAYSTSNGQTRAFQTLHQRLLKKGHLEPEATDLATLGADALAPRNFTCDVTPAFPAGECVIRPIYKRLYELPTLGVEGVLADTVDDGLIALYTALGHEGTSLPTCGAPAAQTVKDGYIPRDLGSAPVMDVTINNCAPCP